PAGVGSKNIAFSLQARDSPEESPPADQAESNVRRIRVAALAKVERTRAAGRCNPTACRSPRGPTPLCPRHRVRDVRFGSEDRSMSSPQRSLRRLSLTARVLVIAVLLSLGTVAVCAQPNPAAPAQAPAAQPAPLADEPKLALV